MMQWCAYCQQFIYESRPFDDYRISHGVCETCLPRIKTFRKEEQKSLVGIIAFFQSLEEIALSGSSADVNYILSESNRLGIRPIDLMMGILQPLLAKIGDLWASNQVTVNLEHRFSALVGDLLAHSRKGLSGNAQPASPELILINAEDNYHTLGLQMAELYFTIHGVPTLTVVPGLPTQEVLDLLNLHRPRVLGFSVALPNQMKQVEELVERTKGFHPATTRILVGGPAVRLGLNSDPSAGFTLCSRPDEALGFLR